MSRGGTNSKIDRVLELFRENKLYQTIENPLVALLVELILTTGATPVDIINIKAEHFKNNTLSFSPHKKKRLEPTTYTLSTEALSTFRNLKKPLHEFSIRRLQQLLKKELTNIGSEHTTARSLRKLFLLEHYTIQNHNSTTTQLTSVTTRTILSIEDQDKLRKAEYSSKNKRLILTLLETGIRISELLQLGPQHIKGNTLQIDFKISHNNSTRKIKLPEILKTYTTTNNYLFSTKKTPLTQRRFEQICKEVAQELDIDTLSPSILRATAIHRLSKTLEEKELLLQTGLGSSTLYTHGFLSSPRTTTTFTREEHTETKGEERESDEGADAFMYHRSKLRDGGDTDE